MAKLYSQISVEAAVHDRIRALARRLSDETGVSVPMSRLLAGALDYYETHLDRASTTKRQREVRRILEVTA